MSAVYLRLKTFENFQFKECFVENEKKKGQAILLSGSLGEFKS